MNVLVIPTTDWIRHPVPNRLNFIFDILAEKHNIYILHFNLTKFRDNQARETKCKLIKSDIIGCESLPIYYILNSPMYLLKIRGIVKKKKIDVILSTNIIPSFMANFSGVPIVFDYLDHLEESASIYYPNSFFGKLVEKVVSTITIYNLRSANSVITVTEELRKFLIGIGVNNIEIIPNGVDTNLIKPLPIDEAKQALGLDGNVIGYVGSLEHWIDLEMVIEALPYLDVTLIIIGPNLFTNYSDKIKQLAKKLGVNNKIQFIGAVPYSELGRYISAMDICLNPLKKMKKNEYAAGGKVFNYLSCGKPVLSSRMISLVTLFGDDLFYYDDRDGLIKTAKNILSSKHDQEKYIEIAKRFDWRVIVKKYEEILRSVL